MITIRPDSIIGRMLARKKSNEKKQESNHEHHFEQIEGVFTKSICSCGQTMYAKEEKR